MALQVLRGLALASTDEKVHLFLTPCMIQSTLQNKVNGKAV